MVSLWGPVAVYMVALYMASERPGLDSIALGWDKLAHAVAYAGLAVLALRATHAGLCQPRVRPSILAVALTVAYGALDELHQMQVRGRDPSWRDWLADLFGAGLAVALVAAVFALRGALTPGASEEP